MGKISMNRMILLVSIVLVILGVNLHVVKAETVAVDGITWSYTVDGENAINIYPIDTTQMKNGGSITSITIPGTIEGKKVTSIAPGAFKDCDNLININIQTNITSIGDSAFYGCKNIESIIIPNELKTIGLFAFRDCISLGSINIPDSVTSIGDSAFLGCTSLPNIRIPSGITEICHSTFSGCTGLENIIMSDSITKIDDFAFYGCASLKSINISSGVKSIGNSAFRGCTSLTNINLPVGNEGMSGYIFADCSNLKGVIIPEGVKGSGNYLFSGCSKLTLISVPRTLVNLGRGAFAGANYNCIYLDKVILDEGISVPGPINTTEGYSKGSLIIAKINAKTKLLELNSELLGPLSRYTKVGGKVTDPQYVEVIAAIGSYSSETEIEAEIDTNKLTSWISEIDKKLTILNIVSQSLELQAAKGTSKTELENYKDASKYRQTEQTKLALEISNGKTAIDNAKTITKITTVLTNTKATIDKIKTDAQLKIEEELVQAKTNAKTSIESYKDVSKYRTTEKNQVVSAINNGKTAIDGASTIEGIELVLNSAKAVIDNIKTDEQLIAEELEAEKTKSKNSLDIYKQASSYRIAQQSELLAAISNGKIAIDNAKTIAEVTTALIKAKSTIDDIKTDEQLKYDADIKINELELEIIKLNSKTELVNYKVLSSYSVEQQATLVEVINSGKTAIESSKTKEEVQTALTNAKASIDAIKTDLPININTGEAERLPLVVISIISMALVVSSIKRKLV